MAYRIQGNIKFFNFLKNWIFLVFFTIQDWILLNYYFEPCNFSALDRHIHITYEIFIPSESNAIINFEKQVYKSQSEYYTWSPYLSSNFSLLTFYCKLDFFYLPALWDCLACATLKYTYLRPVCSKQLQQ